MNSILYSDYYNSEQVSKIKQWPKISSTLSNDRLYTIETYSKTFMPCERFWLFLKSIAYVLICQYEIAKASCSCAILGFKTIELRMQNPPQEIAPTVFSLLPTQLNPEEAVPIVSNLHVQSSSLPIERESKEDWSKINEQLIDCPGKLLECPGLDVRLDNQCMMGTAKMNNHPEITECHCRPLFRRINGPIEQNLSEWGSRNKFEEIFYKKFAENFSSKDQEICILSVGSGGLFQEMVIHANLTKMGYKIHWMLNDPIYGQEGQDPEKNPAISTFKSFAASTSGNSRVSVLAASIEAALTNDLHTKGSPDVVLVNDLDGCNTNGTSLLTQEQCDVIRKNFLKGISLRSPLESIYLFIVQETLKKSAKPIFYAFADKQMSPSRYQIFSSNPPDGAN